MNAETSIAAVPSSCGHLDALTDVDAGLAVLDDECRAIAVRLLADPAAPRFVREWGCWMTWADWTLVWRPNWDRGYAIYYCLVGMQRSKAWMRRVTRAISPVLEVGRGVSLAELCPVNVVNTRGLHFDAVTGVVLGGNDPAALSAVRLYGPGGWGAPWVDSFVFRHRAAERWVQDVGREQIALMAENGTTELLVDFRPTSP